MEQRNVRKQICVENRNSEETKKQKLKYLSATMCGMLNVTRISARQANSMSFVVYYIFLSFSQNASDGFSLSGKLSCKNSHSRWHKQKCSHFELWMIAFGLRKDNKLEWMKRVKRPHFRMHYRHNRIVSHGMDRMSYLHAKSENKRPKLMEIDTRSTSRQREWESVSGSSVHANSRRKCHSVQRFKDTKEFLSRTFCCAYVIAFISLVCFCLSSRCSV